MSDSFVLLLQQHHIIFACLFGIIPAVLWLWFWLKEDIHPEPTKLIIYTFLGGMLAVFVAIPIQQWLQGMIGDLSTNYVFIFLLWATVEEMLKFGIAWIGGIHTVSDDEPIDPIIYLIVAALGFTAIENTLFIIDPLISGNITDALITGNLRFIGAGLLHVISSGTLGVFLGLSFKKSRAKRFAYATIGCLLAIGLHWLFNLSIIDAAEGGMFLIFGCVWAAIIILVLLFERVKLT